MDQAKMMEKIVGPADVASDPSIIERPLRVPRWEGCTALLTAREMLVNICLGRERLGAAQGGMVGGGRGKGAARG